MGLIGLKFCGGCNPVIDRSGLVKEIERLLPPEWRLVTEPSNELWEKALLVCGCPVACADQPEVKTLARQWILISGPLIDLEAVPEKDLAAWIMRKIQP